MKNTTWIYVVFIVSALFTTALQAQTEITPFYGYRFGGEFKDTLTRTTVNISEENIVGFLVNIDRDAHSQYEFLYSHQSSEVTSNTSTQNFDVDIDYFHFGGTALWPNDNVIPFLAGGLGLTHMSPDISGSDSATRFSFSLGGGLKWFPGKRVGVRLEARAYGTLFDSGSAIFCTNGNCNFSVSGNLFTQFETNVGVIFRF